jgi:hypothetical protein
MLSKRDLGQTVELMEQSLRRLPPDLLEGQHSVVEVAHP